ncbi:hypothetical protein QJS10_CPB19g01384 [Acorus calamus]|uniref:Uncharacterized protein n=1 Tax=Acorus calamus TaxID=4465 RepID=A0AAV9CHV5_ACOCL|nr:hypothetical protein QJS10_CPB19g01384 [Acorus calamus]
MGELGLLVEGENFLKLISQEEALSAILKNHLHLFVEHILGSYYEIIHTDRSDELDDHLNAVSHD